jgi:hypothetical protein
MTSEAYCLHYLCDIQLTSCHSLGRSSGQGALSIWTHNLKGIDWHDSFVPQGAPAAVNGVPAVTLQAGEQWFGRCNSSNNSNKKSRKLTGACRRLPSCSKTGSVSSRRISTHRRGGRGICARRRPFAICTLLWPRCR